MQTTPGKIDRGLRLDLVGVDSLMSAELATLIRQSFDCRCPDWKSPAHHT